MVRGGGGIEWLEILGGVHRNFFGGSTATGVWGSSYRLVLIEITIHILCHVSLEGFLCDLESYK